MFKSKNHIINVLCSAILIFALLAPTYAKFSHLFQGHKHELCENPQTSHFHELDTDCEFYKFKLSTQFSISFGDISFLENKILSQKIKSQYHFISDYQRLHYSLRGPPSLV